MRWRPSPCRVRARSHSRPLPEASIPVELRPQSGRRTKPYVTLAIHNTGPAIPDHESRQLFSSWFSSKPPAEGSGLSLWWARQSLEAQGGAITLDPASSAGATFRLWFPLSDFTEAEPAPGEGPPARILMMGQEPALEEAAAALRSTGCRVTATLRNALELINTTDQPYHALVVLSDVAEAEVRPIIQAIRIRRWAKPASFARPHRTRRPRHGRCVPTSSFPSHCINRNTAPSCARRSRISFRLLLLKSNTAYKTPSRLCQSKNRGS